MTYKYKYEYLGCKYKYKYLRSKYEYEYFETVLEYQVAYYITEGTGKMRMCRC